MEKTTAAAAAAVGGDRSKFRTFAVVPKLPESGAEFVAEKDTLVLLSSSRCTSKAAVQKSGQWFVRKGMPPAGHVLLRDFFY